MSGTETILNITVNAAAGADPKGIADAIGRAFNRQVQHLARPVQPMQAVVTNLELGETLLCSESPARELTQGIHAVSAAINAVGNHLPPQDAQSLFPHLKALVSELDRQLVPAPASVAAQPPWAAPERLDLTPGVVVDFTPSKMSDDPLTLACMWVGALSIVAIAGLRYAQAFGLIAV